MNEDEFVKLSNIICPLFENKQSVVSIVETHKEIGCSARTIYCVVSSIRTMPENEKTPAMRVEIYSLKFTPFLELVTKVRLYLHQINV